jgi:DNA-binding transcriptional MerR regulator
MRIGELAGKSGVPVRMLRYYEERALLAPHRASNGYREYTDSDVDRVALVSSLVRSGLPTKLIVPLMQHRTDAPDSPAAAQLVSAFEEEAARLDAKIACMTLSRKAVQQYLDAHRPLARTA